MAGIDLQIKRIRNTPYKLLYSGARAIGIFDHNNYVSMINVSGNLEAVVREHCEPPESSGAMGKGGVNNLCRSG